MRGLYILSCNAKVALLILEGGGFKVLEAAYKYQYSICEYAAQYLKKTLCKKRNYPRTLPRDGSFITERKHTCTLMQALVHLSLLGQLLSALSGIYLVDCVKPG
jgi:hypothetical protein